MYPTTPLARDRVVQTLCLVNGQRTGVDPTDRGLAYGDGLFETMAANDGNIRWLDWHLDRLEEGCRRLAIPVPERGVIASEIAACCPSHGRAVVKLIVTRGPGARGYRPPIASSPTRVLTVSAWPDYPGERYRRGIRMQTCALRLSRSVALAGIKHLCRLEQVLAQQELPAERAEQGLLLDVGEQVVGGTSSNLFVVHAGALGTPSITHAGIKGVMRRVVLAAAGELGVPAGEREMSLAEVFAADELFVTNAVFGIWPVAELDGRRFEIGSITQRLMDHIGMAYVA